MAAGSKFMNVIRLLIGSKKTTTTTKKASINDPCRPCGEKIEPPQITRFEVHPPKMIHLIPSRWQWHKTKDLLNFYLMLGLIPVCGLMFYANVFIGPAQLAEIPEDYIPEHWEYYRHPISRFLARHVFPNPQQEYEKLMHLTYEEDEKMKIRLLERQIRRKMAERNDYQAWYYRPAMSKYVRIGKEGADFLESIRGD